MIASRREFLGGLAVVPSSVLMQSISEMERDVFRGINGKRAAADLQPLDWDAGLCRTAREHSQRMVAAGFFGHEDPRDGDLAARLRAAGVAWLRCGENVFRESYSPTQRRWPLCRGGIAKGTGGIC